MSALARRHPAWVFGVVLFMITMAVLGLIAARLDSGSADVVESNAWPAGRKGGPLGPDVCSIDNPATLGLVVTLSPEARRPTPRARGIQTPLLAAPDEALDAAGLDRLFVSNVDTRADLPADATDVRPLAVQASDPDIHSCNLTLADKPAAVRLRDEAASYLEKQGYVTDTEVADPSTVWMVSDTALGDGRIAMFTLVQKPLAHVFATEPNERHVFLTVFSSKGGGILGAAPVNLYAAAEIAPGDVIEPGTPGASPTPVSTASTPLPSPSAALVPVSSPTTTAPEP